ncbi:MAG TPA: YMGG-like glycine zipper-containing protein [Gemmatimonadaceae bacterium]|nr:YMGG-like glycine zipper-containing protein [Gemmatimonadaceae bacterium]
MKTYKMLVLVPAAVVAAACGRNQTPTDDALKNDLALAAQAQPYNPQQFASPTELGYAYNPATGQYQPVPQYQSPAAQQPVYRTVSRPTTTRRASTSSSSSRSSGRVVYQPAPAPEPVRHTKRDAAIGAAAGAVIGATTSRDKIKGAIIGGVAGAVLGGVIGHTVDVQKQY